MHSIRSAGAHPESLAWCQNHGMTRAVVIALSIVCVLDASPANACTCAPPRAACNQFWQVAAVFAGRVTQIAPVPERPGILAVRFAVEQRGRGVDSETVVVESAPQDGVNCGYTFRVGESYVVYAGAAPGGQLTTNMCSGTKLAKDAAADLAFLKEVAGPPRGVRVFGHVRRIEEDLVSFGRRDYGGVAGARVEVIGDRASREGTTGQDGSYDFSDLPPGRYTVTVTPPKGLALAGPPLPREQHHPPPRSVTLTNPSECAETWTWPRTDSQISGVLRNADGSAADEEVIDLIAVSSVTRVDKVIPHVSVRTGADGRFTFAFIPPGTYLVGVNLGNPPPASQLDRRSYHPGVTDPPTATKVTVDAGSRIELAPFKLQDWPLVRRISGTVMWSDGVPATDATVTIFGAASERVPLDSAGRFTLTLPYGAQFWVNARASRAVNGVRVQGNSSPLTIGRNDRDGELSVVLKLPR